MISEILEILGLISSLPKEKNGNESSRTDEIDLTERKLISDSKIISDLIPTFELVSADNQNWTKTYFDKNHNENWIFYYVNSSQHGGGQQILIKLPFPTTEKLIDIAINNEKKDEAIAACYILIQNEETAKEEFRLALINKLENIEDRIRQQIIIKFTSLTSDLNRKDVLGKSINQIEIDGKYYRNIAERASKL